MITPYPKRRTVKPRAFYVRLVTGIIPVLIVYGLMVFNFQKALAYLDLVSPLPTWGRALFAGAYSALTALMIGGMAYMVREWVWATVYVVTGTVRFSGLVGTKIPFGVRLRNDDEIEFITVSDTIVGPTGRAEVEVCVPWTTLRRTNSKV